MTRYDYIERVIRLYRQAPDTPENPRRGDRTIAGQFHQQRVPIEIIEHAIELASIRRRMRSPEYQPLEPIRSLAYLRPLIQHLLRTGVDDNYRQYVAARYATLNN